MNGKNVGLLIIVLLACAAQAPAAELMRERFDRWDAGRWKVEGRGTSGVQGGALRLAGCEAAAGEAGWTNYELSFRARAPQNSKEVQIWASVRRTARDSRYAIGLRGGNNHQIYIARYAPNGRQVFLGVQPLSFDPRPGEWYRVRIAVTGQTIKVYLNQDTTPRMVVSDARVGALKRGGISLGGGYLEAEYDDVAVRPLAAEAPVAVIGLRAIKIDFQPEASAPVAGWIKATGADYEKGRGFGWAKDMSRGERKRGMLADAVRDTVVSVAQEFYDNEFRYDLENGEYLVTVWAGDPGFAIDGRIIFQGDEAGAEAVKLVSGQSVAVARQVRVTDGALRVRVVRPNVPGISVQALGIEKRADVAEARWKEAVAKSKTTESGEVSDEAKRRRQRAAYRPVAIENLGPMRTEISLDGKWLFLPDYEFKAGVDYANPRLDDRGWHVMDVPALWTPADNWLYDDKQGGSDRWVELERKRLGQYSFAWRKTKAAWYRQVIEMKEAPEGRRFELNFDAIAKVAEIWVNGHRAAVNVGMFHPAQVDITSWVRPGRNTIAVRVAASGPGENPAEAGKVATVAVTVAVTEGMLKSLPQAIYCGAPAGIWQPVKLVVHQAVQVSDVYFQPRLDGAKVELTLENRSGAPCEVTPELGFTNKRTGSAMNLKADFEAVALRAGETRSITLDTGILAPELWTPAKPKLYAMRVGLRCGGTLVDERRLDVGFRTFEVRKDGRIYLNGKPYWLRGACHTPMPTCPNDAALAERFTRLMHEGKVRVSRTVCAPWNELWLSCADRNGVGISQEGTWSWLMIGGKMPSPEILEYWRQEHLALIKKYRNHPSILFWTVNNESYYVQNQDPKVMEKTMTVLSDTIKAMRAIDPSRPICPDSGGVYSMFPPFYKQMEREKGFDYGDIDDKHDYTSWYVNSFFQHYPGQAYDKHFRAFATPGRPMISQEKATGYPNADDGQTIRKYIFDHMVPQAWVGDDAYEHQDPKHILDSVAFNTKELAETLRCYYRDSMAGVVHFALNCWYQNLFEADRIQPYRAAKDLATALQPVLVSARMYGRHHYAGTLPRVSAFVVNDDEDGRDLGPTQLRWSLEWEGRKMTGGSQEIPVTPYYHNTMTTLTLAVPPELPRERVDARLILKLYEGDALVSENNYDLILAVPSWVKLKKEKAVAVVDGARASEALWRAVGVEPQWMEGIPESNPQTAIRKPQSLVICDYGWAKDANQVKRFIQSVESGGNVLLINPGEKLKFLFPELVRTFRSADGEIVTMRVPESPVFDQIRAGDMRWFEMGTGHTPMAAHGDYLLNESGVIEILAKHTPIHAYLTPPMLKDMEGAAIFTIRRGAGRVWVTQMAHEAAGRDPIPARVLRNLVEAIESTI